MRKYFIALCICLCNDTILVLYPDTYMDTCVIMYFICIYACLYMLCNDTILVLYPDIHIWMHDMCYNVLRLYLCLLVYVV